MKSLDHQPIAITMGDPAGIGPETIAMLYRDELAAMQGVVVYGDVAVMQRAARIVGVDAAHIPVHQVGVRCADARLPVFGQINAIAGRMAAAAVEAAAQSALLGGVAAVVTAPLHKEALALAGVNYPGHTEMLQALCGNPSVRMMLANDELKTVLVNIHVSLRTALDSLSADGIFETIHIAHDFLHHTGLSNPRIAVAGVNPHAGEGGLFGSEESTIIAPAVARARAIGINASGAYAPDTVFMRARQGEFDVVIAMYHDQGLIPVKYLGLEAGVNVTLGLPIIRTSPDHGTAMAIAGKNKADPRGLLYALQKAREFIH
ncbi:MAG: 4-hydroxythreonine-4-phosphate dehydrogenase PdxA [Cytophagales bacterium]|nr:4-hydroxythreonine-4-phosphate dehydrogenase PdxA [Cytophagales bacterium]